MNWKHSAFGILAAGAALAAWGCGPGNTSTSAADGSISGMIVIDGSSTVLPVSEAMAEEFGALHSGAQVNVAASGTGGGFKKFANGEIDITGASRPIEQSEVDACRANGVEFIEIPVAFDGLSVVINPQNDFASTLTVEELRKIWEPNSSVKTWADVRPGWPTQTIRLYGPGTDSGTFDYFTKAIVGKEKASRSDFQSSENDNVLVQGVSGDRYSLGYFGFSYYLENRDRLKLVAIDAGNGGVQPNENSISDGTYQPLSRPLFYYVNKKSLEEKPVVGEFLKFVLGEGREYLQEVGYVGLPDEAYTLANERITNRTAGTTFSGAEIGVSLQEVLRRQAQ
jgi:phosphate transport system substrate-binding protein